MPFDASLVTVMADGNTQPLVASGFGQVLDAATLASARRGDMAAFATIYRMYGRACYTLAFRVVGQPAAAEDLVQDVFLRLIQRIGSYRGDAPFGAWLKRMTVNAVIDLVRHQSHRETGDEDVVAAAAAPDHASTDDAIDAWRLIQRLPPRIRAVVVLSHWEGYTHQELADRFGQSESWSKSILSRALGQLKLSHAQPQDQP